jgi:aspartyl-tRNA(Asn)/glutamyl-tRNA(Gln) amidotransferase subunit A
MDLTTLTIVQAHKKLIDREITAVELAQQFLTAIAKKNPELNIYLEVYDDVLEQARQADARIAAGTATVLTGIPLSIKDNILIKGKVASSASKMLEKYRATYDATVIEKLKAMGAVFLGRTNMDEFAMGGSTENSAYGVVKNPHDPRRVPGGSSGGAAASVAAHLCIAALGSDTGGSIRQPASFCGNVGMKPTYGAVSRHGLMAMASSLDQIGPIAKTVEDAQILFDAIRGKDRYDSTSTDIDAHQNAPAAAHTSTAARSSNGKTIGIPSAFLREGVDPEILQNFNQTIEKLKGAGYTVKDIELPNIKYSLAVYYILMPAEVSSNLARFDGVKYGLHVDGTGLLQDYEKSRAHGFGKEARRRIILGTYVLSTGYYDAYYNKAHTVRKLLIDDFEKAFKDVDFIVTPTSPTLPFKIGERSSDPLSMYLADIFTVSANLVEMPAISVPSGMIARDGVTLPVGIQFTAPYAHDATLFEIGKVIENIVKV